MKKIYKKNNISLLSLVYRIVGNIFIGKTDSLGQKKDFYDIPIDREMPSPKKADDYFFKENIKTDYIRRKLLLGVGKFTAIFSIIFFGIFIFTAPYLGYHDPLANFTPNIKNSSILPAGLNQSPPGNNQKINSNLQDSTTSTRSLFN